MFIHILFGDLNCVEICQDVVSMHGSIVTVTSAFFLEKKNLKIKTILRINDSDRNFIYQLLILLPSIMRKNLFVLSLDDSRNLKAFSDISAIEGSFLGSLSISYDMSYYTN